MKKGLIKKIILGTVCIILSIGLTGCGTSLTNFVGSTLPQAIRERGEANKRTAKKFVTVGALSQEQYETIEKNIDKQVQSYIDKYVNEDESVQQQALAGLAPAVSHMTIVDGDTVKLPSTVDSTDENGVTNTYYGFLGGNSGIFYYGRKAENGEYYTDIPVSDGSFKIPYTKKDGNALSYITNYVISNHVAFTVQGGKNYSGDASIKVPDNEVDPIELVSEDVSDIINEAMRAKLFILKSNYFTDSDTNTLDSLIANVSKTIESNDTDEKKTGELNAYFASAIDENGDPIYLIDPDDEAFDIIKTSRENNDLINRPGYDLIIGQKDLKDCIRLRFKEFDDDAVALFENYFAGENIYLLKDKQDGWRAYLMTYPIEVIDEMKLCDRAEDWAKDKSGAENVEVTLKKSGLGINIKTGQFIKYEKNGNSFDYTKSELVTTDTGNLYLTLTPAQNNDATGQSSLIVNGVSNYSIEDSSGNKYKFNCGRIILRDYLEATYAPGYNADISESSLAVFGRKIRLDMSNSHFFDDPDKTFKLSGTTVNQSVLVYERGTQVGSFVDKNGIEVPGSPKLEITDFCDYKTLMGKDPNNCLIQRMPYKNEESFTNKKDVTSDVPDTTELSVTNETETIHPVTWFPSSDIGKKDFNTDTKQKQRFYCIATTKGMFGSALYSSWVESTVPDANLEWWNEYLSENGFSYKVSTVDVVQYLSDNFKYQLSQNGVVILDLETIEKIQEMYDDEADQKRVGTIRTAFVLLGWILVVGSFLLLLLWVIDTNTDVGLGLLEKVTFGNWVAVRYEEDIPYHNVNDQKYMTFKRILISVMIIIAIGILLIRIDVFYIITVIVDMFGQLASQIEKIIKGRI